MNPWKTWKTQFDAWEGATAALLDQVLQSPLVLGPAGTMLTKAMKAKAEADKHANAAWAAAGGATRHDQERTLHAVHQVGSRLIDLEEELASQRQLIEALHAEVRELRVASPAPAPASKPRTRRKTAAKT